MSSFRLFAHVSVVSIVVIAVQFSGCEKKPEPTKPAASAQAKPDDHAHGVGDGHEHAAPSSGSPSESHGGDAHGPTTDLGDQTADGFGIKASRDGGVTPGKDAPVDVWVSSGSAKVAAVRFWIGTRDAKGSVRAKAELEKDNWHTHVEVPNPLPPDSMLWVEVESEGGKKTVVGFDLKL